MTEEKAETLPADKVRLLTWNMNGVRSFDDFQDRITNCGADIICIQETKVMMMFVVMISPICGVQVTRDMLTESVALIPEFSSYFSFSRLRSGYSGVATYCRAVVTPVQAQSGLTQDQISACWAGLSSREFCQSLNMTTWVLSRAVKEVKKYFSVPVQICTALGITRAVFSFVMAVT